MKAMRIVTGLLPPKGESPLDLSSSLIVPKIPNTWSSWFYIHNMSTLACVQDVVHVAVKLKCRLIKPSVLLPMGDYVAGSHHIRIVQFTYGKDQHGLCERDVDYKDKQNYDAVLHIIRASQHLDSIPDAAGTKCYIELMQCLVESYLNKSIDPLVRIEKIWYVVFLTLLAAVDSCMSPIHSAKQFCHE